MTDTRVTIRRLQDEESDLRQVVSIENLSFNKDDAYSREDFKRWMGYNPDFCMVAEIDGRIVGDMICRILRYKLDLASCAIHPDYRRYGIGSALLKEMETLARKFGVRKIELQVRKTNSSGLAFWQKMGFEESGILPGFYPDGEDGLQMSKKI
jgi:[ribosomal protein S18]-alanine N-acetyltransferase